MLARLMEWALEADRRVLGRISVLLQPLAEADEHERMQVIENECLRTLERAGVTQTIVLYGDPRLLDPVPRRAPARGEDAAAADGGD